MRKQIPVSSRLQNHSTPTRARTLNSVPGALGNSWRHFSIRPCDWSISVTCSIYYILIGSRYTVFLLLLENSAFEFCSHHTYAYVRFLSMKELLGFPRSSQSYPQHLIRRVERANVVSKNKARRLITKAGGLELEPLNLLYMYTAHWFLWGIQDRFNRFRVHIELSARTIKKKSWNIVG